MDTCILCDKEGSMAGKKLVYPQLSFIFTPRAFVCDVAKDAQDGKPHIAFESLTWYQQFEEDRFGALYDLGFVDVEAWFTPSLRFLHRVSECFMKCMVQQSDIEYLRENTAPELSHETFQDLLLTLPFAPGSEYVDEEWIQGIFYELVLVFRRELTAWKGTVEQYIAEKTQDLRVPGRIFFHLVENPSGRDDGYPFAFMATYATQGNEGIIEHLPLHYALGEYEHDQRKLLSLISRLGIASQESEFVSELMESGELFHPLRLNADEAYAFLRDIPICEQAGILCRVPNWWKRRSSKVSVNIRIGQNKPKGIGATTLIALTPSFTVDGEEFSRQEIEDLLKRTEGLAFLKGKWVEVDHKRLQKLLLAFDEAKGQELSFFEALRATADAAQDDLREVTRGEWLDALMHRMRTPAMIDAYEMPKSLDATLRPYQQTGFAWLSYLAELGFGSCLADDMGLGKTIQVLAFLERLRVSDSAKPHVLLVVPASLVGNWTHELEKFAPGLDYKVLYGESAARINRDWQGIESDKLPEDFPTLCITTYAMAQKIDLVKTVHWDVLILDEAQAIKNPNTKQTKELKVVPAGTRIALTGTPIENDLSNLWSLFDFLNPGLLGTAKEFKTYVDNLDDSASGYAPLRQTISPFILRRLKTDRSIIKDLPEKTEIPFYAELTHKQIVLYSQVTNELEETLDNADFQLSKRSGLVLATITKLKQICNHPDQYLGQNGYLDKDSGKFQMLQELCQTIYEKRERVLVFTQFREMCEPLNRYLSVVFERPGLVIHGQVPAKKRTQLVEQFQGEDYVPYMILSLKAGGTGLNLTAANNVIHFDRWWNPAVENQATDRAFRIGQTKNVMVYKLICQQTLEERIDEIINSKSKLLNDVVGEGESWLGAMDNAQLMQLLRFGEGR